MKHDSIGPRRMPFSLLVVDDEYPHRKLVEDIFSEPDYAVCTAASGAEALARIREQEFDVILLDKRMPGMDGDELCRRIRRDLQLPLLPVIMVTGSDSHNDLVKSLTAGANDFVRKPYNPVELLARVDSAAGRKRVTDQLDSAESLLFAVARMVEAKDGCTGDHCSRLVHAGEVFGRALGLDDEELLALRRGGVLHDIGKLGIPDSILLKRGSLSDDEWRIMRQHAIIGAHMCSGLKSIRGTVPIIRHHHERWDGSGYPDGLRGEEIPLLARVFQIADIHDALASTRPYKPAWPREKIIDTLEQESAGGWRDPELMAVFLDILRSRPADLSLPECVEKDLGMKVYEGVVATGALEWDRTKYGG